MKSQKKFLAITLWTARITGSLMLAFFLFFLLAHIFGNAESKGNGFSDTTEVFMFIFFPVMYIAGLALALRWEGLGSLVIFVGMAGLFTLRPDLLSNPYIIMPLLPGILYGVYWYLSRKKINAQHHTGLLDDA